MSKLLIRQKESGKSVAKLGKELGYSQQAMDYVLRNKKFKPERNQLKDLAKALGCKASDILKDED